jgi:hypothetical protein
MEYGIPYAMHPVVPGKFHLNMVINRCRFNRQIPGERYGEDALRTPGSRGHKPQQRPMIQLESGARTSPTVRPPRQVAHPDMHKFEHK